MPSIKFNSLRLSFWEDVAGKATASRPLTPDETNKVREIIHNLLFEDEGMDKFNTLAEEIASGDPRHVEIDWDEDTTYE